METLCLPKSFISFPPSQLPLSEKYGIHIFTWGRSLSISVNRVGGRKSNGTLSRSFVSFRKNRSLFGGVLINASADGLACDFSKATSLNSTVTAVPSQVFVDETNYSEQIFSAEDLTEHDSSPPEIAQPPEGIILDTEDSSSDEDKKTKVVAEVSALEKKKTGKQEADVLMPRSRQEGLLDDVRGLDNETLVTSDSVYNKELNWLSFNWRVLNMALDHRTPLFERLRFVAISARNLDEFFSKRVGALKRQEAAGVENLTQGSMARTWTPKQQLKLIAKEVEIMVQTQLYSLLIEILPALRKEGVVLQQWEELSDKQKKNLRTYFKTSLEPVLTPLAVDPGHPFPFIGNFILSIAVVLRDPLDGDINFAIVSVPSTMPRYKAVVSFEDDETTNNSFIAVEQIIRANLDRLFGGMEIISAHFFRATRNADVARSEDEAEDLLEMITDEMRERKFAPFVRLEVECEMPEDMLQKLTTELCLTSKDDVSLICGPLALGDLDSLPVKFRLQSPLLFPSWAPQTHPRLQNGDIFEVIRNGDLLVHHPYHSFATSTQYFVEAAAADPKVRAIKATLYRTSSDSPVIMALAKAADSGKQVAVLVELKARFDEARNVGFAQMLEDAGCNVAYGLIGLKTHCKCTMVVREEDDGFRTYVHIGTGNYNPRTAAVYTDFGLFSCKPELGQDVADLFKYLTGYHRQVAYKKLLVAPGTMRKEFVRLVDREIANAQEGLPASVVVKCNGLDDQIMVAKLYEASQAGVHIDCIVRGMCRIRAGVEGISENIRVISIIGRFLEHHRIMRFENGGNPEYFIGSADWMTRNLMRRVEVVTPVDDDGIKKELQDIIDACLGDCRSAWEMKPDGRYQLLGLGSMADLPKREFQNPSSTLSKAADLGLQPAIMDKIMRECKKAKKVKLRKKQGSILKPRR